MNQPSKLLCENCTWQGLDTELLTAPHPFDSSLITGCPNCLQVETTISACAMPGCWNRASGGGPTASGYVFCCSQHLPRPAPQSPEVT